MNDASRMPNGLILLLAVFLVLLLGVGRGWWQIWMADQSGAVAGGRITGVTTDLGLLNRFSYQYDIYTIDGGRSVYTDSIYPAGGNMVGLTWKVGTPVEVQYWPEDPRVAHISGVLPLELAMMTLPLGLLLAIGLLRLLRG